MKIQSIDIENFKGIDSLKLRPDDSKIYAFIGPNGAGKSSILEAIRFALTGEAPDSAIQNGTSATHVKADLFDIGIVSRSITKSGKRLSINGKATTQKSFQQLTESIFGVSMDAAKVITSANVLTKMKAGELSEFLVNSGLIPVRLTMKQLLSMCPLSDKAAKKLAATLPAEPETFGLTELNEAYKTVYSSRTAVNRELAALKAKSQYDGPKPKYSLKSLEKKLQELLINEGKYKAQQKLIVAYEDACRQYQEHEKLMKALADEIKKNTAKKPEEGHEEALHRKVEELQSKAAELKSSIAILQTNIEVFEKTLKRLDTTICPLSNKLVCSTDKTPIKQELTDTIKTNRAKVAHLTAELERVASSLTSTQAELSAFQKQKKAFQDKEMLCSKYEFMKKHLPVIPEKPELLPSIEDNQKNIAWLQEQKNIVLSYEAALKWGKEAKQTQEELDVISELIDTLDPKKGIREKIISFALSPLIDYCNEKASRLKTGFQINIQTSNGTHLMCKPKESSDYQELSAASSGEQLLATFLITDMLNALSGYGILMLDDLDKVDDSSLNNLLSLLCDREVSDSYDHIFLAGVNHDDTVKTIQSYKDIRMMNLNV